MNRQLNDHYQKVYEAEIQFFLDMSARAGDEVDDNEFEDYCNRKFDECFEDQQYAAMSDEQWARIHSYRRSRVQWYNFSHRVNETLHGKIVKPLSR